LRLRTAWGSRRPMTPVRRGHDAARPAGTPGYPRASTIAAARNRLASSARLARAALPGPENPLYRCEIPLGWVAVGKGDVARFFLSGSGQRVGLGRRAPMRCAEVTVADLGPRRQARRRIATGLAAGESPLSGPPARPRTSRSASTFSAVSHRLKHHEFCARSTRRPAPGRCTNPRGIPWLRAGPPPAAKASGYRVGGEHLDTP